MTSSRDGALLAHISDTVTALAEGLDEHREVQRNILSVLSALLEANQAQSEMLSDILEAATQEVGPSPVAQALEALVAVVERMDEAQAVLIASLIELPEAIGRQFEAGLREGRAVEPAGP